MSPVRELADQAFFACRTCALIEGNSVRLLMDARENYPACLESNRRGETLYQLRELHHPTRMMPVGRFANARSPKQKKAFTCA